MPKRVPKQEAPRVFPVTPITMERYGSSNNLIEAQQLQSPLEWFAMRGLFVYEDSITSMALGAGLLYYTARGMKQLRLLLATDGGTIAEGFALVDIMKLLQQKAEIWTIGLKCLSMGALVLCAGTAGRRFIFPNSRVMIHLPQTVCKDIVLSSQDLSVINTQAQLMKVQYATLLKECGAKPSIDKILQDMESTTWMTAKQAIDYGIADAVVTPDMLEVIEKEAT